VHRTAPSIRGAARASSDSGAAMRTEPGGTGRKADRRMARPSSVAARSRRADTSPPEAPNRVAASNPLAEPSPALDIRCSIPGPTRGDSSCHGAPNLDGSQRRGRRPRRRRGTTSLPPRRRLPQSVRMRDALSSCSYLSSLRIEAAATRYVVVQPIPKVRGSANKSDTAKYESTVNKRGTRARTCTS
jgi:hypothetical protein